MKIIMTGGTGLIGSALTQSFINDGHTVSILSRFPEKSTLPRAGVTLVKWDGQSSRGWEERVGEADVIVNLAGESLASGPWTGARKTRLLSSRIQAGQALLEAIRKSSQRPKVLVQSSAVGYYGLSREASFDEDSPAGGDYLAKICVEWEDSTRVAEALGVRRLIIRTGVVLSLTGGAFPQMALPFRLWAGGPIGSGKQWISWIHLADQIGAIRFLIDQPQARGPFNLTTPEPLTNADFGRTLARTMRRPYWLPVPSLALKLLLGDMSTLVLDGQRVIPKNLISAGYPFRYSRLEDALKDVLGNPV